MDDPGTTRYLYAPGERPPGPHTPSSLLDWGRRILADPERVVFGLQEREGGRLVGDARLTPTGRGRAKFSIMIGVGDFRGRGIGGEATAMVCRYGFTQLHLREIILEVDPRNEPAVRAYLSNGFERARGNGMRLPRGRWRELNAP